MSEARLTPTERRVATLIGTLIVVAALVLLLAPGASAATINEFTVPTASSAPEWIAAGPDGALYFTEIPGNNIGRITTGATVTESTVPTASSFPFGIAAGPDGALWFTEVNGNKIGRITAGAAL